VHGAPPALSPGALTTCVAVLLTVDSHCIHGQDDLLNHKIGHVLEPSADDPESVCDMYSYASICLR
jgi:hypothetical protein